MSWTEFMVSSNSCQLKQADSQGTPGPVTEPVGRRDPLQPQARHSCPPPPFASCPQAHCPCSKSQEPDLRAAPARGWAPLPTARSFQALLPRPGWGRGRGPRGGLRAADGHSPGRGRGTCGRETCPNFSTRRSGLFRDAPSTLPAENTVKATRVLRCSLGHSQVQSLSR